MPLYKFLILFFRLPAAVMLFNCYGGTPLYSWNIARLKACSGKSFLKYAAALLCLLLTFNSATAQVDSNYVDTISMRHSEAIEAPIADTSVMNEDAGGYDDQDDGYVDTTVKHIYDTSQFFFNWKSYYSDPFRDKKIEQRRRAEAEVNELKKDDDFWYIPAIEKLEQRIDSDPKFRDSLWKKRELELTDDNQFTLPYQPWFSTVIWIVIIGIFGAALIYFLIQNKISIFAREAASAEEDEAAGAHEDIFNLSYTKLIQQAEKDKDFRIAIRLMFLQILRTLSDTGAIHYQPDFTNLYYLQQLSQSRYYTDFFTVMRNYEYVWYGKFFISPEQYAAIKNDFLKLQNKIR